MDVALIQVIDTDENRNPQIKDTVTVRVRVGNAGTGSFGSIVDAEDTWVLTETGETTGIFRGSALNLLDTIAGGANNGQLQVGLDDTLHLRYVDANSGGDDQSDTALIVDAPTAAVVIQFYDTTFVGTTVPSGA